MRKFLYYYKNACTLMVTYWLAERYLPLIGIDPAGLLQDVVYKLRNLLP